MTANLPEASDLASVAGRLINAEKDWQPHGPLIKPCHIDRIRGRSFEESVEHAPKCRWEVDSAS
ncbi:hypothetical protein [Methylobacterium nigriterrae]|uniref:hypothetical protein n=1 Tax=Methylobacterium nigriterrae TaxID=3127512 RepID=UPI003013D8C5